jgi:hypothetical protein
MRVDCHLTFSCVPPVSCGAFAAFLSLHGGPPAYMSPDCPTGFKSIGHRIASVPVVEVFWPTYPGSCPSQVILPREPPVFIFYSCVAPYTNPCSPSSPQARPKGPRRQPDTATPQGSPRSGCLTCHLNSGTHQPAFNRYAKCVSLNKKSLRSVVPPYGPCRHVLRADSLCHSVGRVPEVVLCGLLFFIVYPPLPGRRDCHTINLPLAWALARGERPPTRPAPVEWGRFADLSHQPPS